MRTKTYIAADFDHDKDAVNILYQWKYDNSLLFDFQDAHDLMQARDTSLYCSIKHSLRTRLQKSKTFVLIVGEHTNTLTKGGCQFCLSYNSWTGCCSRSYYVDFRSYIQYECDMALQDYLTKEIDKIVILYKNSIVNDDLCPKSLRYLGIHLPMIKCINGIYYWDYQTICNTL